MEFSFTVRIYIEDTDPGGIVYYVNYLKFMERARTEFMRSLGFDRSATFNSASMFVVRDLAIRYLSPAFLDDEIRVTVAVTNVKGASIGMRQNIFRGENELVEASLSLVWVDRENLMPSRLSKEMRLALRSEIFDTL
ncbi:MAG: Acyl-CoA thioesterase YbgC [Methanobacteriota archaeon]|nr:MAG: Acyl-CoA thioesterase YbgC [Euryarchaeota archaeon]